MSCHEAAFSIAQGSHDPDVYNKLEPGDIILIQTSGFLYSFWRRLSCSAYDHVAVVLENKETFNILYPVAKKLPASYFFRHGKTPLVLRPSWQNQRQKTDLIQAMEKLEGMHYNSLRGIIGVINMIIYTKLRIKIPMKTPVMSSKTWVCTDATILFLERAVNGFSEIRTLNLDLFKLGYASTNDFIRIACHRPELLKKI